MTEKMASYLHFLPGLQPPKHGPFSALLLFTGHLLINQCGHTHNALENPLLKTACVCAVSSICVFHYSETKGTRAVRGPMGGVIVMPACACQRFPLIMAARRKLARHRPGHTGLQIPQLMTTLPEPANSNVSVFLSFYPPLSRLLRRGSDVGVEVRGRWGGGGAS